MQLIFTCNKVPLEYPFQLDDCRRMAERSSLHHDYETLLRSAGVRITKQRQAILKIIAEAEDHPDAMEIFKRASVLDASVSLPTVYRTMKTLEENGAIRRHTFEGGPSRFEHADSEHHDHLIDMETGDVIEFTSPKIEALQREIADELGYDIVHHRLEIYGKKR